jgi:hypothetical protein
MLLTALLLFTASSVFAQDPTIVIEDGTVARKPGIQIGVLAGLSAGYSTTDYHASEIDRSLGFGPTLLAQAQFPIGTTTRLFAQLGYHTLAFSTKHNQRIAVNRSWDVGSTRLLPGALTTDGSFKYLLVGGGFKISAFFIGLNFGFPASATMTNEMAGQQPDGDGNYFTDKSEYKIPADISPESSNINTLIELRAGGEFPVVQEDIGDLNLGFSLAWTFGNIIKDSGDDLPIMEDQFHIPSVTVHLSWLFNI